MAKPRGYAQLMRQLAALPPASQEEIGEAMKDGADGIARLVRAVAPRSGRLKQPNDGRGDKPMADRIKRVEGGVRVPSGLVRGQKIVAPFPAGFVERGTKARPGGYYRDEKGRKRHGGKRGHAATRPHPFFWPVIRAAKDIVKDKIVEASKRAAKKAASKQ